MKVLRTIGRSAFIQWSAAFFVTNYVRLVWLTSKWVSKGTEPDWCQHKAVIGCFWHGRLLMMFKSWRGSKIHLLISPQPDADVIVRATKNFGFETLLGSSAKGATSRGGAKAFLAILNVLKKGESVGVTPDGPWGPRYQVGPGIIRMARLSGAPILPGTYSSTCGVSMKTWDRFFLPFPFGKGVFMYGPLLDVAGSSKNDEELRQELENTLCDLTMQADLYCGQKTL